MIAGNELPSYGVTSMPTEGAKDPISWFADVQDSKEQGHRVSSWPAQGQACQAADTTSRTSKGSFLFPPPTAHT